MLKTPLGQAAATIALVALGVHGGVVQADAGCVTYEFVFCVIEHTCAPRQIPKGTPGSGYSPKLHY